MRSVELRVLAKLATCATAGSAASMRAAAARDGARAGRRRQARSRRARLDAGRAFDPRARPAACEAGSSKAFWASSWFATGPPSTAATSTNSTARAAVRRGWVMPWAVMRAEHSASPIVGSLTLVNVAAYMYICQVNIAIFLHGADRHDAQSATPAGQGERLRDALIDAARELLLELGDQDKLSVRAVTARAGVSPNALYLHFADKDALLSAVMIAGYKELREQLSATPSPAPTRADRAASRLRRGLPRVRRAAARALPRPVHDQGPRGRADARARRPEGVDEGVDTFNDLLALVARCVPDARDPFTQASLPVGRPSWLCRLPARAGGVPVAAPGGLHRPDDRSAHPGAR